MEQKDLMFHASCFMFHFYYGQPLLVKEAVRQRVAAFLRSYPTGSAQSFDLIQEEHWNQFVQTVLTQSFFEEQKVFVLRNSFEGAALPLLAFLEKHGQAINKHIEVILQETGSGKELEKHCQRLFSFLKSRAETVQSWEERSGAKLDQWVADQFKKAKVGITTRAITKLVLATSPTTERLEQEVEKIIAYQKYQGPLRREETTLVDEETIARLVNAHITVSNFDLIDAVANKDRRRSLSLWHDYLQRGEDPYAMLGLLVYQFRNLLKIKALIKKAVPYAALASWTKWHPFVVKKTFEQAKKFEPDELKKIYQRLFTLEVGAKDGQLDLSIALYEFLLKM